MALEDRHGLHGALDNLFQAIEDLLLGQHDLVGCIFLQLLDPPRNAFICFQSDGIAAIGPIAGLLIGCVSAQALCEPMGKEYMLVVG
jgi:hypothetical protein